MLEKRKDQVENVGYFTFQKADQLFHTFLYKRFHKQFVTTSPRNYIYRMRYLFYEKLSISNFFLRSELHLLFQWYLVLTDQLWLIARSSNVQFSCLIQLHALQSVYSTADGTILLSSNVCLWMQERTNFTTLALR